MNFFTIIFAATGTPVPHFNQDSVTPGWIGFAAIFLVAALVILLCIDMVRRVRRVRYRGEIREQLEAEYEAARVEGENGSRS